MQSPHIAANVAAFIRENKFMVTRDGLFMGNLDIDTYYMGLICRDYQGNEWLHAMNDEDLNTWFKNNNVINNGSINTMVNTATAGTAVSFGDEINDTYPRQQPKHDNSLSNQLNILEDALKDDDFADFNEIMNVDMDDKLVPVKPLFTLNLIACGLKLDYWLSDERHGVNADMSVLSECIQNNIINQVVDEVKSMLPSQIKLEDDHTIYLSYGYKGLFGLMLTEDEFDFDNYSKVIVDEYNFPSIFGRPTNAVKSRFSTDVYVSNENYATTMPYTYTQQSYSELLLKDNKYLIIKDRDNIVRCASNLGIDITEYLKLETLDIAGYSTIEGSKLYIMEWHEFEWKLAVQQNGEYYNIGIYREILPSLFN